MKTNDVFPGRYLKADDLDGDTLVTIASVAMEVMKQQDGTEDDKPVLYTLEYAKGLVLNKTNWKAIAELYGDESDGWTGKKIVLTTMRVDAFGKVTDALRVVKPGRSAQPSHDEVNRELGEAQLPA